MLGPQQLPIAAIDWATRARQYVADAKVLLGARSWQTAYSHAGLATEMALKAYIMHHTRMNAWPDRRTRPDLYTHSLNDLAAIAGLRPALEQEVVNVSSLGVAWMTVKDVDINSRYPMGQLFPRKLAEDAVGGVDGRGLVEWLLTGIR